MHGETAYLHELLSRPGRRIKISHDISPLPELTAENWGGLQEPVGFYDLPGIYAMGPEPYRQPQPQAWFEGLDFPPTPQPATVTPEIQEPVRQPPQGYTPQPMPLEMEQMLMKMAYAEMMAYTPLDTPEPISLPPAPSAAEDISPLEMLIQQEHIPVQPEPLATDFIEQELQQMVQEPDPFMILQQADCQQGILMDAFFHEQQLLDRQMMMNWIDPMFGPGM